MMDNETQLKPISISVKEAARISDISIRKMRTLISDGSVASALVAGRRLVFYKELEEFIKGENYEI